MGLACGTGPGIGTVSKPPLAWCTGKTVERAETAANAIVYKILHEAKLHKKVLVLLEMTMSFA